MALLICHDVLDCTQYSSLINQDVWFFQRRIAVYRSTERRAAVYHSTEAVKLEGCQSHLEVLLEPIAGPLRQSLIKSV